MSGDTTLFQAVITPNLSLSRSAAITVVAVLGGLNLLTGSAFFIIGAWPVVGFLGLDVAAVALAFYLCRRKAGGREEVSLTTHELLIRRISVNGLSEETKLNPYWARLRRYPSDEDGLVALDVISHGQSHRVASALSPPERADFADALEQALHKMREIA